MLPARKKLIIPFSMKTSGRIRLVLFLASWLPAIMSGQDASVGISSVTSGLEGYRTTNPFEELWLHTDRETYVAGEVVRVKAYLLSYPDLRHFREGELRVRRAARLLQ